MYDYHFNDPDQVIDKSSSKDKVWLEATTINILPGENVSFDLSEKDEHPLQHNQDTIKAVCTVNEQGTVKAFVASFEEEDAIEGSLNIFLQNEDSGGTTSSYEITKGWWSIDAAGEKPITRALPGMTVYFHVETQYIDDYENLNMYLFDDDSDEEGGMDSIELVQPESDLAFFEQEVVDDKVVCKITFNNLKNTIDKEEDKLLELFFRCSYGNVEADLPAEKTEYLRIGEMVVDRYKMPGLNEDGTDIAEDMTYGYGIVVNDPIYSPNLLSQYKQDYEEFGFDEEKPSLFSNEKDFEYVDLYPSEGETPASPPEEIFNVLKQDNLKPYHTNWDYEQLETGKYNANRKNKYTREEAYKVQYEIPEGRREQINNAIDGFNDFMDGLVEGANESIEGLIDDIPPISSPSDIPNIDSISTGDNIESHEKWCSDFILYRIFQERAKKLFASGLLEINISNMIRKFFFGNGGVYQNAILTHHVKNSPSIDRYCIYVENYIAERLKNNFHELQVVEDKVPTFSNNKRKRQNQGKSKGAKIGKVDVDPAFTKPAPLTESNKKIGASVVHDIITSAVPTPSFMPSPIPIGLTIAVNDIWATQVTIKELKHKGDNYTCKYEVIFWDHFGLNLNDMRGFISTVPYAQGLFSAWYVLQHLRGYKPFVTKIKFTKEFTGNFTKGKEERLEEGLYITLGIK